MLLLLFLGWLDLKFYKRYHYFIIYRSFLNFGVTFRLSNFNKKLDLAEYIFLNIILALQVFGRDWKKVENFVETRTGA